MAFSIHEEFYNYYTKKKTDYMENKFYVAKTVDRKYSIFSKQTEQKVLSESFDLIISFIGNRYVIVGNESRRRFRDRYREAEVTEYSYRYHAFDLLTGNELFPLEDDSYSLLYIDIDNQIIYYSLESDEERIILERGLDGRPRRYNGPVKNTSRGFNYLLPATPENKESPDYVSPEKDIDSTGVFPHTDSKWDVFYSFLYEDKNCDHVHRYCFSCRDIRVPNAQP